jgi:hypothetical protein
MWFDDPSWLLKCWMASAAGQGLINLETFDELGKSIPEEQGLKQPVSLG